VETTSRTRKEEFPGMLVVVEGGKIVAKQRVKHVNDQHIM
jgi:hypothetical protein